MRLMLQNSKKRTVMWSIILVILFIAILGFVYIVYFREAGVSVAPGIIIGGRKMPAVNTEFNEKLLSDPKFQELKIHGKLPVRAGTKGQVNPFKIPESDQKKGL